MLELWRDSLAAVNLPYTLLLGLALLYWITVIVGILDLDLFDLEVGTDADVELPGEVGDADVEAAHSSEGVGDFGLALLKFFHVGVVPTMIILSFLFLGSWASSVVLNRLLENSSIAVACGLFFPILLIALLFTKITTLPFRALFQRLHVEDQETRVIIGRVCVVKTSKVDDLSGQAEIPATGGAPILLNTRAVRGQVIENGEEAVVVGYDEEKKVHLIRRL